MSSQNDVIELGSSDDEPQPKEPPKSSTKMAEYQKVAKVKNTPNAMVHIPAGVSIRPAKKNSKPKLTSVNIKPGVKSFIPFRPPILPINLVVNPCNNQVKRPQPSPIGNFIKVASGTTINQRRNNNQFNPKINNNQKLKIAKNVNPFNIWKPNTVKPGPSKVSDAYQNVKILPKLPAGITVTKTKTQSSLKRPVVPNASHKIPGVPNTNLKRPAAPNPNLVIKKPRFAGPQTIETVSLDDDDPLAIESPSRPQWYVHPEDHNETDLNKEPADSNMVEITIEDSPIKPKHKQNNENSVTVDDSPFKQMEQESGSDNETNNTQNTSNSKRKLEYSATVNQVETQNDEECSIEIELIPMSDDNEVHNNVESTPISEDKTSTYDKQKDKPSTNLPVNADKTIEKEKLKAITAMDNSNTALEKNNKEDSGEFHHVYQKFIDLCLELDNSNDMEIIVEKKIKAYYRQVPKDYTESEDFIDIVQTKIDLMRSVPKDMFLFIKDVVDQLNSQRKKEKYSQSTAAKEESEDNIVVVPEHDSKRARQIRKLEKTLKKLHRAIQKLEEQEVDFDDDGDSVYILTERYKERVVKVHAKLCQLTNSKMPSLPRIEIPGQPSGPAKRLNKWLNRRLPPGIPCPFPDFHDVLRCVREANEKDKLGWNEVDVMEEARDLFTRCGKKLQRRRQENEWRIAASRLTTHEDPAEVSNELKMKLEENRKVAAQRESELINKFADRQKQLKLEAEEITEKEANESTAESDDDVAIISDDEIDVLENKERRKQRLVRLLKEKSKHKSDKELDGDDDMQTETPDVHNAESHNNEEKKTDVATEAESKEENNEITVDTDKTETSISKPVCDVPEEIKTSSDKDGSESNEDKDSHENISVKDNSDKYNEKKFNAKICDKDSTDKNSEKNSDKDSNGLNSDIDELHLLQKLHSENELQSSDDSLIAISDSLESNSNSVSDSNKQSPNSVFSIEDSTSGSLDQENALLNISSVEDNESQDQPQAYEDVTYKGDENTNEKQNDDKNALQNPEHQDENSYMTINSEGQSIDNQETNKESRTTDDGNTKDDTIDIQNDNAMDVDYSKNEKEENNGLENSEILYNEEVRKQNSANDDIDMDTNEKDTTNVCDNEVNDHEKDGIFNESKANCDDKRINSDNNEVEISVHQSNNSNHNILEFEVQVLGNVNSSVDVNLEGEL